MRSWYQIVRDAKMKDGSTTAVYVMTFETDDKELKQRIEQFFQRLMDERDMRKCYNCKHWSYAHGCQSKKYVCKFETLECEAEGE